MLKKLQAVLRKIVELLTRLEQALREAKQAAKAATGMDKVRRQAQFAGKNALVGTGVKVGTLGFVAPPTTGSADEYYYQGWGHASDATGTTR